MYLLDISSFSQFLPQLSNKRVLKEGNLQVRIFCCLQDLLYDVQNEILC
uniref:Uncharacterized protein n=1 Tax=Arundo donax TaxID=35708 RepID=A0A0A8YEK4_ARUDO